MGIDSQQPRVSKEEVLAEPLLVQAFISSEHVMGVTSEGIKNCKIIAMVYQVKEWHF